MTTRQNRVTETIADAIDDARERVTKLEEIMTRWIALAELDEWTDEQEAEYTRIDRDLADRGITVTL